MIERKVTAVDLALIAGTRVALGIGIGLLLSGKLSRRQRKAAGLVLALAGGVSTVPLVLRVFRRKGEITDFRAA